MPQELSSSARRVDESLSAAGLTGRVSELPASTRTVAEAAGAVGCQAAQIVKSLVFRGRETGRPVLAVVSGANRVDEARLAAVVGERVERADPEFVKEKTGFAIGGIPPVGHAESLEIVVDEDLLQYGEVWAAAGNPHAVCRLTPAELVRVTGGRVVRLK